MQSNKTYQKYMLNIMALYGQRRDIKAYLEILLSIVTIAIFVFFAIKPTLTTIGDLLSKIKQEQETSDQLDIKIKNIGIAQTTFNNNQGLINLLDQALPTGPNILNFTRQIETLGAKNSVSILSMGASNLNLKTPINLPVSNQTEITTSVSGSFSNIKSFLQDMENLLRPSIASKVGLNLTAQTVSKTLYLTITFKVPFVQ